MTIGIGLLARGGVVVAADTQTGIPNDVKMGYGRIAFAERGFAITGAGNASYIEALRFSEVEWYLENNRDLTLQNIEDHLVDRVAEFHENHILPFAQYQSYERPDVQLLIAARKDQRYCLWSTENNTLIPRWQYGAVGIGGMFAKTLLHQFWITDGDVGIMSLLAAYVVFRVKEHIDGCGHDTDIVVLHGGGAQYANRKKIRQLEEIFREYSWLEAGMLHHALRPEQLEVEKECERLSKRLETLRAEIASIDLFQKSGST